jgi:hypothetical protein
MWRFTVPAPDHDRHQALVFGAGLAFLLTGSALLVQEFGLLTIEWSVVLPVVLIAVGAATALAGVLGAARGSGP